MGLTKSMPESKSF